MPSFGKTSQRRLDTCHPLLKLVMDHVILDFDCSILCGERSEIEQTKAYEEKRSKVQYPNSKHNKTPSLAVDVAPYPIDWDDTKRFYLFSGIVIGTARRLGVRLRWGGDWDGDLNIKEQTFNDLVHFELIED